MAESEMDYIVFCEYPNPDGDSNIPVDLRNVKEYNKGVDCIKFLMISQATITWSFSRNWQADIAHLKILSRYEKLNIPIKVEKRN